MHVGGIGRPAIRCAARRATADRHEPAAEQARALIAVEAAAPGERLMAQARHPAAPFLAHLIATQMQAPQTRARRRAEPEEAIAVYAAMTRPVARRRFDGKWI